MNWDHIFTSIGIGLLATTSPCVFPLYPGYLAYLSTARLDAAENNGVRKYRYFILGIFVLAGVMTMMLLLGALFSILALSIGKALTYIIPIADLVLIVLGLLLILDHNPFKRIPQIKIPLLSHPYLNAYTYGLLYGPIALPCSGPLVISIFALSLRSGALNQLSTFFWFGLGLGLPLLFLSIIGSIWRKPITKFFATNSRFVNLVSGFVITGLGIYDLFQNYDMIRTGLGY